MLTRLFWMILFSLVTAQCVRADLPWNGPGPRPPRPMPHDFPPPLPDPVPGPPKAAPRLVILHDSNAKTGELILPANLVAGMKPAETPRLASTFPGAIVGLALVGSLIAGGLWLARMPRAKYLLGVMLPLLGLAFIGAAVQAQPAKVEAPRGAIEHGKVRISRDAKATNIRLVLPKRNN